MREKQLIQLWQFILAWILLWLFIVFVKEESFINFVLRYRLYLLIVSVSYFYYYSIQYEPDKKFELIRNVIIYGNTYLFLHIFFRPLLNISHQLFVLLWLIILWLRWTTKLVSRWKYLLQVLWWLFSFFILVSGMFYFYPEAPDIDWFLKWRNCEILVLWAEGKVNKNDAYLKMTNKMGNFDTEIVPSFSRIISEDYKISYPSTTMQRNENVVIRSVQWDLIWIFPQSEIQLEFSWNDLKKISNLNWRIWFLSWVFEPSVEYVWDAQDLTPEQQERFEWIYNTYKYELVFYLKNQISDSNISWANNTIMYDIDGKIIGFLAKMFPVSFGKNLNNYNEFQKYFSRVDEWVDLGRYEMKQWSWWSVSSMWKNIKSNMNIWRNNTYKVFKD